jgi:hypothetical protein
MLKILKDLELHIFFKKELNKINKNNDMHICISVCVVLIVQHC